jgi:hypothetical protein
MNLDLGRRQLLGAFLVLPAGIFLVRCGSSDASTPSGAPVSDGTQTTYTSSNASGHTHTFVIQNVVFTTAPAQGVNGATSTTSGHSHDVAVTMAELQAVGAGQTVEVTTTSVGGHAHVFTFTKVAPAPVQSGHYGGY